MFRFVRRSAEIAGTAVMRGVQELPAAQDPAVRRYFSSGVNWFFLLFALILYAVAWPTLTLTHSMPAYVLPVCAAFAALPIAFAWSAPLLGWAISVVSAQLIGIVVPTAHGWIWTIQVTHIISLLVLTFFAYLRCHLRWLPLVWASTSLVFFIAAPSDQRGGWVFGLTFLAVVIALVRFLAQSRRQLAERTEQTELAESANAILSERARIARDLHDVVAHRMSVVVVMAQTARYRLDDVSDAAADEFDSIAVAARASLDEVRQMLGVLRTDGETLAAPNPGLSDLASLIMQTRMAGAEVMLSNTIPDAETVGDTSGLAIYRIIQESLANATRHAPGGAIDVRLAQVSDNLIEIEVRNGPAIGEPVRIPGAGAGILGMSERAATVNGVLTTGHLEGGGFRVHALIPAQTGAAVVPPVGTVPPGNLA